jgi:hypothetical protein
MMQPNESQFSGVVGESVLDGEGRRVGKVVGTASRPDTLEPEWLVVRTSMFGKQRLVPVDGASEDGGTVHVGFSKEAILSAPTPDIPTSLAANERQALVEHYRGS